MARLAATEHGADWVINTDADEFWMPHEATLKDVFAAVPEPWGRAYALSRHFVPRPDDGALFAERMTVRVSPAAAINDPTSPYRPHLKAAHRADREITVSFGSHTAASPRWRAVHHWHPADVLHFPFRSLDAMGEQGRPAGKGRQAARAVRHGAEGERGRPERRPVPPRSWSTTATLERGRADGLARHRTFACGMPCARLAGMGATGSRGQGVTQGCCPKARRCATRTSCGCTVSSTGSNVRVGGAQQTENGESR